MDNAAAVCDFEYCRRMLPRVSRTFALNIAVLRGDLHRAVLCGYLFCRIVDTVEDSEQLPLDLRAKLCARYAEIFRKKDFSPAALGDWASAFSGLDGQDPEVELARGCARVFSVFQELSAPMREALSDCVIEMAEGMRKVVLRRLSSPQGTLSLKTTAELDEYCYFVAGTVGVMLSRLFYAAGAVDAARFERLRLLDVSFGEGLQLVNIIKDCYGDFSRGRCFIPDEISLGRGAVFAELLGAGRTTDMLCVLDALMEKALRHLDEAFEYTLALPRTAPRVRLFCLWPLLMAVATLAACRANPRLVDGTGSVKITRAEVKSILRKTSLGVFSDWYLRRLYGGMRKRFLDKTLRL